LQPSPPLAAGAFSFLAVNEETQMVDVTKYTLSKFIKAEEFRGGKVIVDQINAVTEDSKYGRLQVFFSNGRIVSLNEKNVGVLMREFGADSDDWLWKRIRLSHGTVEYKGEWKDTIVVESAEGDDITSLIEPKPSTAPAVKKKTTGTDDDGSDIPF
jgi:hypothetical protein